MSTKLYHGLKLPKMAAHELRQFFLKLRVDFEAHARGVYYYDIVQRCESRLDRAILAGEAPEIDSRSIFMHNARFIRDRGLEAEKSGQRHPLVDFGLEYMVFPLEHTTLAYPYSERFMDWACNYPGFTGWGYWNNTDPPEDVSDEEWAEREADWDEVYTADVPGSRPVDYGFSYTVHGTVASWSILDATIRGINGEEWGLPVDPADHAQPFAERVKRRARYAAIEDHMGDKDLEGSELFRQLSKYRRSPEFEAAMEAHFHLIEAKLPETYPIEAFTDTLDWFEENYD